MSVNPTTGTTGAGMTQIAIRVTVPGRVAVQCI